MKTWSAEEQVNAEDLNANFLRVLTVYNATAGEALSANDAVYLSLADNKVYKTDASDGDLTYGFVGFATEAASADDTVEVQKLGFIDGFSSLTEGAQYFLSDTAGGISTTQGTNVYHVGFAVSDTKIYIEPTGNKILTVHTSSTTWNKKAGLKYIDIEVQAGGGNGGAGGSTSNGGSGASGGYGRKRIYANDLGSSETVTVGAVAGNSSFGSHVTCTGGTSASGGTAGVAGTASGGDLNISGVNGSAGLENSGSGSSSEYRAPTGANSVLGIGGGSTSGNGGAASGYGAGGGGAYRSASGGAGKQGVVIITEYY